MKKIMALLLKIVVVIGLLHGLVLLSNVISEKEVYHSLSFYYWGILTLPLGIVVFWLAFASNFDYTTSFGVVKLIFIIGFLLFLVIAAPSGCNEKIEKVKSLNKSNATSFEKQEELMYTHFRTLRPVVRQDTA